MSAPAFIICLYIYIYYILIIYLYMYITNTFCVFSQRLMNKKRDAW